MTINDCIREIHENRTLYSSFKLSIDAFTNVLLNVLFNAMANVAIYDTITKHDHNVIVQTVSVTHTVNCTYC